MLTKKLWLLAVPVAVIAIQGCGGGGNGLLQPNRTPRPANTPTPGVTATPAATAIPGTTPVPNPTAVPGTTPVPNPTAVPTATPNPTTAPNPMAGDNIGRYSSVAPTNGQNNVDSTDFAPPPPDRDPNSGGNSIVLTQTKGDNSTRTFKFQVGNEGFIVGRSYSFDPAFGTGPGAAASSYTQGTRNANAPDGVTVGLWDVVGGTLIVDSITIVNGGIESISFRVVNARYQPSGVLAPNDPSVQTQGNFTFNFSGTAAAFRG